MEDNPPCAASTRLGGVSAIMSGDGPGLQSRCQPPPKRLIKALIIVASAAAVVVGVAVSQRRRSHHQAPTPREPEPMHSKSYNGKPEGNETLKPPEWHMDAILNGTRTNSSSNEQQLEGSKQAAGAAAGAGAAPAASAAAAGSTGSGPSPPPKDPMGIENVLGIDEQAANTTDTLAALLGTQELGNTFERVKGTWFARAKVCDVHTSQDFVDAMGDPSCEVVSLQPGVAYVTGAQEIVVERRVVIVGNPVNRPLLDGTLAERPFRVKSGGHLETMYTRVYRGRGIINDLGNSLRGGFVLVENGGSVTCRSTDFTGPISLQQSFRQSEVMGGTILQLGGMVSLSLCRFIGIVPMGTRNNYVFGGDVLVLAGTLVVTNCLFFTNNLISRTTGVGSSLCVLEGVVIATGVRWMKAAPFNLNALVGALVFCGAGVVIMTGCMNVGYVNVGVYWGSAVYAFAGAGVVVITGQFSVYNLLFGATASIGGLAFVGAGIASLVGWRTGANLVGQFGSSVGGTAWVGAGYMNMAGWEMASGSMGAMGWGLGAVLGVGTGDMDALWVRFQSASTMSSSMYYGAQNYVGQGNLRVYTAQGARGSILYYSRSQGTIGCVSSGTLEARDQTDRGFGYWGYRNNNTYRYMVGAMVSLNGTEFHPDPLRVPSAPPPQHHHNHHAHVHHVHHLHPNKRALARHASRSPAAIAPSLPPPPPSRVHICSGTTGVQPPPMNLPQAWHDLGLQELHEPLLYAGEPVAECGIHNMTTGDDDIGGPGAHACVVDEDSCDTTQSTPTVEEVLDQGLLPTTYLTSATVQIQCAGRRSSRACSDALAVKTAFAAFLENGLQGKPPPDRSKKRLLHDSLETFRVAAVRMGTIHRKFADLYPLNPTHEINTENDHSHHHTDGDSDDDIDDVTDDDIGGSEGVKGGDVSDDSKGGGKGGGGGERAINGSSNGRPSTCQRPSMFQVYVVTHDDWRSGVIRETLNAFRATDASNVTAELTKVLAGAMGVDEGHVCGVDVSKGLSIDVPGIKAQDLNDKHAGPRPPVGDLGGFSKSMGMAPFVEVFASGSASHPLTEVRHRHTYNVTIENVPELCMVTVRLISGTTGLPEQLIGVVSVPKGQSSASLSWTVKPPQKHHQRFYLEAAYGVGPNLRAHSEAITMLK